MSPCCVLGTGLEHSVLLGHVKGVGRNWEMMVIIKGMVRSLKLCLCQQPLLILEMLV